MNGALRHFFFSVVFLRLRLLAEVVAEIYKNSHPYTHSAPKAVADTDDKKLLRPFIYGSITGSSLVRPQWTLAGSSSSSIALCVWPTTTTGG